MCNDRLEIDITEGIIEIYGEPAAQAALAL
jgi:hypothetical protein